MVNMKRIRTPGQFVRSLSKRNSKDKEVKYDSSEYDHDRVTIKATADNGADGDGATGDGADGGSTTSKVTELTESLRGMRSDFESFKRSSSMERDALVRELHVIKGMAQVAEDLERGEQCDESANPNAAPSRYEQQGDEEGQQGCGISSMFESLSVQFDDDGYLKCCLADK
mmetsp:Transcript_4685/g.10431  ORF Transcript_4685/g.10431 Transcript_4685/m.10431 type:complete len:171 (-) Transcript_4685:205-717(-)